MNDLREKILEEIACFSQTQPKYTKEMLADKITSAVVERIGRLNKYDPKIEKGMMYLTNNKYLDAKDVHVRLDDLIKMLKGE